tara:strand:- start:1016 stop:1507 length:492 start_codon:yes stop_codon:yes gene_type:complete
MLPKLLIFNDVPASALVAYVHYLGIILCFGALIFERITLKINLSKNETISIIIADVIYGIAGLAILITGILRVKYYGQGGGFYTSNPIFWVKVSLYILIGILSLYPTITYVLWAIPLSKNKLPVISENLVNRFKLIIMTELVGFAVIPFFATLMSRGIGLVQT